MKEPSCYLKKEKNRTLLNPEKIVNNLDGLTKKVLMAMILVVMNMGDTTSARRASLVNLFTILMVSGKKPKTKKTKLEEQKIFNKLKF